MMQIDQSEIEVASTFLKACTKHLPEIAQQANSDKKSAAYMLAVSAIIATNTFDKLVEQNKELLSLVNKSKEPPKESPKAATL